MKNTSHSAQSLLSAAVVLGLGVSLAACSTQPTNDDSSAVSSQTEQVETSDGEVSAPAEDTVSQGFVDEDGDVPDRVADGFPIYPGSEVAAAAESGDKTIISFSVPSAEAQAIYDWFGDEYSQNGWEARNMDDENMSFAADNTDGRSATINVTKSTFAMSAGQG